MQKIELSPLRNAISQLETGLHQAESEPGNELLRDGVIQRFEYSHELALRFIKRVLKTLHNDLLEQMPYNDILRTAADRKYIQNIEHWFTYRDARNKTSHAYDAFIAAEVYGVVPNFLEDIRILLQQLEHAIAH